LDKNEKSVQRTALIPFALLVLIYCVWILSLPLFPAQDSPMHLYIASVLSSLLSGSNHFSTYFYVRHLVTPYCLHYYFLIIFGRIFSFPIADKLLVCAVIVCSAFGFRYLALTVGPSGDVMSLFAIPLFLSWPLGMGFYNYCLSLGLAFWALGFWSRAVSDRSNRMGTFFLGTVMLMALTHPIPVALVVAFVALHLGWRMLQELLRTSIRSRGLYRRFARFGREIFYVALASFSLVYIAYFASKHVVVNKPHRIYDPMGALGAIVRAQYLSLYAGVRLTTQLDRLSLYVILALAILFASQGFLGRWRMHNSSFGDVLLTCALLLAVILVLLPPNLHAVDAISARLILIVWLAALAASSGHSRFSPRIRIAVASIACIYAVAVLALANVRIRPVANKIATIENLPVVVDKRAGLGLDIQDRPVGTELGFDPYYWTTARYFRRTRSTMFNSGWTYQHYILLGSRSHSISDGLTPEIMGTPWELEDLLLRSPVEQRKILPQSDLLVFLGYAKNPQDMVADAHAIDLQEPQRVWSCQNEDWYFVCTKSKN